MKKLFIFLTAMTLCSCGTLTKYTFVQVLKANAVDKTNITDVGKGMVYEDANCSIYYWFWAEGGNSGFKLYNKTDKILYVDLAKSFFVKNGVAYDFYTNRSIQSGSKETTSKLSTYNSGFYSLATIGSENETTIATTIYESPIIAIPPKAYKIIAENVIHNALILDCDLNRFPSDSASIVFAAEDSPITYSNYITYHVGEGTENITVENEFYISKVTNYASPAFCKFIQREKRPCQNITDGEEANGPYQIKVYDIVYNVDNSNCFYLKYSKATQKVLYSSKEMDELIYSEKYDGYIKASDKPEEPKFQQNKIVFPAD